VYCYRWDGTTPEIGISRSKTEPGAAALNAMTTLLRTKSPLVIRTDFSNQAIWEKIRDALGAHVGDFHANVEMVDNAENKGVTKEQLLGLLSGSYAHSFMVIVDQTAVLNPDHPLLIVDLLGVFGREFRALPSAVQEIENNLSMTNMGFENLAGAVDGRGVFCGFFGCRL
jgi:hypothetical protein